MIARNQRALKRFGAQFHHRQVQKFYVALVEGSFLGPTQRWQDFLRKIENQAQAEIVPPEAPSARLAELQVRPIYSDGVQSLVLIRMFTGRMHQIRLQLSCRGLPIAGDALYGSRSTFCDGTSHALHALRLEFRHPTSAIQMSATAPFPSSWSDAPADIQAACDRLCEFSSHSNAANWELDSLEAFSP